MLIKELQDFKESIQELDDSEKIPEEVKNSFKILFDSILKETVNNLSESYKVICEHFTLEAKTLLECSENIPLNQIQKLEALEISMKKLDVKLNCKPPLSSDVRAAICGVIGAIVGFIIGATVGGVLSAYSGGFGSILGGILGAVKGFTVGTKIGLTFGLFCGFDSFIFGFYSGKNKQRKFKEEKVSKNVKKTITDLRQILRK